MKKTLLFLVFSMFLSAQNTQRIYLSQNIKDKKELSKSLTFIDNRLDKEIGTIDTRKGPVEIKFDSDDVKSEVEKWFTDDNKKPKGNNDFVILLEELNISENPEDKSPLLKTKISSFLKRNDTYYFVNRYENVDGFNPKAAPSAVSTKIAYNMADMVRESYTKLPIGLPIPEAELLNYETFLIKNLKVFNANPLPEGVYESYKDFLELKAKPGYHTAKNKKNEIVKIENEKNLRVKDLDYFGFVEDGIPYKITPVGYLEIFRDEKGLYVVSNRAELFPQNSSGLSVGLMMGGGILGAAIGVAIDSQSRKNRQDLGFYNVYLDSFTGNYVFEK